MEKELLLDSACLSNKKIDRNNYWIEVTILDVNSSHSLAFVKYEFYIPHLNRSQKLGQPVPESILSQNQKVRYHSTHNDKDPYLPV